VGSQEKEVLVSEVSKCLIESDLINKTYAAFSRTIDDSNCFQASEAEMDLLQDMTEEETYVENESDDIDSKLVGKPLFVVHLDPSPNQEVVQCLADKKVRARQQLHAIS